MTATPPTGTRLILATKDFFDSLGTRTEDGYRIHADWGKPDENGWYAPTFTIDYDDRLNVAEHAPNFGSDS